ncbi:hypothetical protein CAPTEDRAFT_219385 [Capitella teleta]|uniref:Transmembrane protein n=1 Tax=Capitella teleta TaxID=283909 RepID=R7TNC4_CAPTE|nr:hypothetical protein CAPTEDRAFT_219385 [Capitella teleta]|eukprot:ELT92580.1 hypothetical protein CAPTEDRAFT_219385 [Capitella teleta]
MPQSFATSSFAMLRQTETQKWEAIAVPRTLMEVLSRFRRLIVYLGIFIFGLVVLVVAVALPYWELGSTNEHRGLWMSCMEGACYAWMSDELNKLGEIPSMCYKVSQTLFLSSVVMAILAVAAYTSWITQHKDHRLMVITCMLCLTSGLTDAAGALVFALWRDDHISYSLSWGFWIAAMSAVVLLVISVVLILDRGIMTRLEHQRVSGPIYGVSPSKTNPAFLGSTNAFNRNSTVSTVGQQADYGQPSNYLLPEGIRQGARSASVGSMEDDPRQPWAAGSGQLF